MHRGCHGMTTTTAGTCAQVLWEHDSLGVDTSSGVGWGAQDKQA